MKTFYTFILGLLLFMPLCTNAQTTRTFIQETGGLWSFPGHWSGGMVPTAQDDVIIPSDTALDVDINAFAKSITIQDRAEMDIDNNLTVGSGTFEAGSTVDWVTGTITVQGTGILTIEGQLNVTSNLPKTLTRSILRIESEMNIVDAVNSIGFSFGGTLQVAPNGSLNIEGNVDFLNQQGGGKIDNRGIINIPTNVGNSNWAGYSADGGTLNLGSGSITTSGGGTIKNGIFNIPTDGFFAPVFNSNRSVLSGTLTGQLDGPFIINAAVAIEDGDVAILDFTGSAGVEYAGSNISAQGTGTLINRGLFTVTGNLTTNTQLNNLRFRNEGLFIITEGARMGMRSSTVFENTTSGIFTIFDGEPIFTAESSRFVNYGLIQKTSGTGTTELQAVVENISPGIISIETGRIIVNTAYSGNGTLAGKGIFIPIPASTDITGTIAPGINGVGTLFFSNQREFDSTIDTIYQLELNGTIPDVEHDVFAINTPAKLNGTLDIILGFAPQIDDEFVVITSPDIAQCNLPAQVTAVFDGMEYTYDVVCNSTDVTLKVISATLGTIDNALSYARLFPNPTTGELNIQIPETVIHIDVKITNMLGQTISRESFSNTGSIQMNLEGDSGMYFVRLSDDQDNIETIKVFKR